MTTSLIQPTRFSVPTITPRPGELLDVATIVPSDTKWLPTTGLFESFHCVPTDSIATIPCPAVFLGAPTMTAPSTNTSGGTLAAGTYRAVITAVNARGETVASNEVSQVTTGATSRVIWNWNDVSGETSYNLYVTAVDGAVGTEKFLINLPAGTVTYNWTGTPAVGTVTPPTINTAVVSVTKTFAASGFQDGFQFAAYSGHVCKGFGTDGESLAELQRVFEANESVAVERAIMQQRMVVNGTVWAAATDLTPAGGAVSAKAGLAILEGHASWKYAGVPTIHAPRSIGSLLTQGGSVVRQGDALYSVLGAKVAAGGGYEQPNTGPAGTAPSAGEKWMFASGEVAVVRSEIEAHTTMNQATNETFSLVERMYVVAVDCYTSAVRVKVE
jgi:hypothetical protein